MGNSINVGTGGVGINQAQVSQMIAASLSTLNAPGTLAGKKIVFFGDSITEFGTIPEQIATITAATTYKIGFGGARMGEFPSSSYDELCMYKVANSVATQDWTNMQAAITALIPVPDDNTPAFNRLQAIDFTTVDLAIVWYGGNDFTSNYVTLGTPLTLGATLDFNIATIRGATNLVIKTLTNAYPNLKIAFITPMHRYLGYAGDRSADFYPNTAGKYLIEYCDAVKEVANYNHLPCFHIYKEGGLNIYNHIFYFGTDGGHPNSVGYTYLAKKISAWIKTLFSF